jgi:hypothetical protein
MRRTGKHPVIAKESLPGQKVAGLCLVHQLIQPVIHVARDGQSANMRARLFQLADPSGRNGSWIAGIYECKTGIEEGIWKFMAMDLDYIWKDFGGRSLPRWALTQNPLIYGNIKCIAVAKLSQQRQAHQAKRIGGTPMNTDKLKSHREIGAYLRLSVSHKINLELPSFTGCVRCG